MTTTILNGSTSPSTPSSPSAPPTPSPTPDISASRDMCKHAFCVLLSRLGLHDLTHLTKYADRSSLSSSSLSSLDNGDATAAARVPRNLSHLIPAGSGGVFVTWSVPSPSSSMRNKGGNTNYILRGCIGTLKPAASVADAVGRYAAHAAFNDPRFDAIRPQELRRLKVGVSVLSRFESADDVYDWTIGTHGIILDIKQTTSGGGQRTLSATYLPEVCKDHSWSKQHCVQSLAEKAGFIGTLQGKALQEASVTRYQSSKYEMTFEAFVDEIFASEQQLVLS